MARGLKVTASDLTHRVVVQRFVAGTPDAHGQPSGDWIAAGEEYVALETMGPQLSEQARQLYQLATHRVLMRYRPDITRKGWRLAWQGRTFDIGHVQNINEQRHTLVLLCSEVT
jgi:SPP1 family predicted phage head-tail adaptor